MNSGYSGAAGGSGGGLRKKDKKGDFADPYSVSILLVTSYITHFLSSSSCFLPFSMSINASYSLDGHWTLCVCVSECLLMCMRPSDAFLCLCRDVSLEEKFLHFTFIPLTLLPTSALK